MASCNLQNNGACLCRFREIRVFSRNLTDFVNYNKPLHDTFEINLKMSMLECSVLNVGVTIFCFQYKYYKRNTFTQCLSITGSVFKKSCDGNGTIILTFYDPPLEIRQFTKYMTFFIWVLENDNKDNILIPCNNFSSIGKQMGPKRNHINLQKYECHLKSWILESDHNFLSQLLMLCKKHIATDAFHLKIVGRKN